MNSFAKESLHIDDVVVYLKNERTGSSTVRKCKFVGIVNGFTKTKVEIHRLSPPDTFVKLDEIQNLGIDTICSDDVVHIIYSPCEEDSRTKMLRELNAIIAKQDKDIKMLLGRWFSALEDEGVNPWISEECMEIANKHWYTEEEHKKYLNTIA